MFCRCHNVGRLFMAFPKTIWQSPKLRFGGIDGEFCNCRNKLLMYSYGQCCPSWAALIHRLCGVFVFNPLSHPNNRNVYVYIQNMHLTVHREWYMNEYQWTVYVFIWHIDMYLPFCVSIFCCYHACRALFNQNSLTALAMYMYYKCLPGQSWSVMTFGDF